MNKTLDTAINLARQGIYVYPLSAGSKVPLKNSHGEHNATLDQNVIKEWFVQNPNYNLGINLSASRLAVIDLDQHANEINGIKNWRKYLLNHGPQYTDSLKTYIERTPRIGYHLFYKFNGSLPREDIKLVPGVELLSGKVMVAPSFISKYNRSYSPQLQGFPRLDINQLLTLPGWIAELANEVFSKPQPSVVYQNTKKLWTGRLIDEVCEGTATGNRHNWLCHIAGMIKHSGANTVPAYELLQFANQHCDEPLPDKEVESIFVSLFSKGA